MNLVDKALQQSAVIKQQYPGVLLLFPIGAFFEAFNDDAVTIATILHLTLTKRGNVPMVGFPKHSRDSYIARLTATGHRVAICENADAVDVQ